MNWIIDGLTWVFDLIVGFTNSYGWAIIIVTLAIRLVLMPLTIKQTKSMNMLKEVQPLINEINEKYKSNPQEMQAKTLKLYQDYKINPLGGCLPMLVQLPILWSFYRVLNGLQAGAAAQFFYLDLTIPDPYYILPVLATVTQYFQMKSTATDSSQKTMVMFMPLMIGFISARLPAGLALYWVIGGLFSIAQQLWIAKMYPVNLQGGQNK